MKTVSHAPDGFFAAEAQGLRWLAEATAAGGVRGARGARAATRAVSSCAGSSPARPRPTSAGAFGQALAATHLAGAAAFGADQDGFIASLPMPNRVADTWAEFYAVRRVLPYLKLARDRGHASDDDAAAIEAVIGRLTDLLPVEPPARLHGDLWNGNVLWGQDGQIWLIDPAAYGGHRELDLAMLSLFGMPHLPRVLDSYAEAAPLADGWEDRVGPAPAVPAAGARRAVRRRLRRPGGRRGSPLRLAGEYRTTQHDAEQKTAAGIGGASTHHPPIDGPDLQRTPGTTIRCIRAPPSDQRTNTQRTPLRVCAAGAASHTLAPTLRSSRKRPVHAFPFTRNLSLPGMVRTLSSAFLATYVAVTVRFFGRRDDLVAERALVRPLPELVDDAVAALQLRCRDDEAGPDDEPLRRTAPWPGSPPR